MKKLKVLSFAAIMLLAACNNDAPMDNKTKQDSNIQTETAKKDKVTSEDKSIATTEDITTEQVKTSTTEEPTEETSDKKEVSTVRQFSNQEQEAMVDEFYNWAAPRAETANMAITKLYFNHGAAGFGDWYADTPDGEVQTQDNKKPGFDEFKIHSIGGIVFYTREDGQTGAKELDSTVTAYGYSKDAQPGTKLHKYMLADNGTVYELILPYERASFSTGFGEYDDNGKRGEFEPTFKFEISQDEAAQSKWKEILAKYQ